MEKVDYKLNFYLFIIHCVGIMEMSHHFQFCDATMFNERAPKELSHLCPSAALRDQDYIINSSYIQMDLIRSRMMLRFFECE